MLYKTISFELTIAIHFYVDNCSRIATYSNETVGVLFIDIDTFLSLVVFWCSLCKLTCLVQVFMYLSFHQHYGSTIEIWRFLNSNLVSLLVKNF